MNIRIYSDDKLRINTNGENLFVDASAAFLQEALTIDFYSFQKQQIRSKDGIFRVFIFQKDQDITDFDFGYFSDAEIIWESK